MSFSVIYLIVNDLKISSGIFFILTVQRTFNLKFQQYIWKIYQEFFRNFNLVNSSIVYLKIRWIRNAVSELRGNSEMYGNQMFKIN
jgi:hypothetical protein